MWPGLEGGIPSPYSEVPRSSPILLFSVAARAVLKLWLPQTRRTHSNDLLSKDIKCSQLPVGLCELTPSWKQNPRPLNYHMWKYNCSSLTRAWNFAPAELHKTRLPPSVLPNLCISVTAHVELGLVRVAHTHGPLAGQMRRSTWNVSRYGAQQRKDHTAVMGGLLCSSVSWKHELYHQIPVAFWHLHFTAHLFSLC